MSILTIASGSVKAGETTFEITGNALDALQLAEMFVQVFSLSQRSKLITEARNARAEGFEAEAKAVETAVWLWTKAEAVYSTPGGRPDRGAEITHVQVGKYTASRFTDGAVDAEVTFECRRADGRQASMFAQVTLLKDGRDLFGVSNWPEPACWLSPGALNTLDPEHLPLLAEAIDEAVNQNRCREEVA